MIRSVASVATLFTGLYEQLTAAQQRAVHRLTLRRYLEEIHLHEYLECVLGLSPGSAAFEAAYGEKLAAISTTLGRFDARTYISALLLADEDEEWVALAAMRSLWGQRKDVSVAASIGSVDSSIPTHTLLQSFAYPRLRDFDPEAVTEAEIFEASRLVTADRKLTQRLSSSGVMSEAELHAVLACAFDELIVSAVRNGHAKAQMAGWIFNVKPKLAALLKRRKGLDLIPLFLTGVEPTAHALSAALDAPYFHRWRAELHKIRPDLEAHAAILDTVRSCLADEARTWQECEISLPYLVVNNDDFEQAIRRLEAKLARRVHRPKREGTNG